MTHRPQGAAAGPEGGQRWRGQRRLHPLRAEVQGLSPRVPWCGRSPSPAPRLEPSVPTSSPCLPQPPHSRGKLWLLFPCAPCPPELLTWCAQDLSGSTLRPTSGTERRGRNSTATSLQASCWSWPLARGHPQIHTCLDMSVHVCHQYTCVTHSAGEHVAPG